MTTREKMLFLKENGFSATKIAKMVKCSPSTVNNWLNGITNISLRLEEDIEMAIRDLIVKINSIV